MIIDKLKVNVDINMPIQDNEAFKNAYKCYICDNAKGGFDYTSKCLCKVRDHDHSNGKYIGAAHSECNLKRNNKNVKIPVFFHNLKGYDAHHIISNAHLLGKKNINAICQNSEKFISFSFDKFVFKDSMAFLALSLEKLVKLNKYKEEDKKDVLRGDWKDYFKISAQNPDLNTDEKLFEATEKGVYPYDYVDSFDKFEETELPSIKEFYSKLYKEDIKDIEYERAKKIWELNGMKNFGQYHDFYLSSDVYLLADVMENFRDICLKDYGLDPVHYYTLPNFGWDAMLYKTGIKLDNITDLEMYEMIEQGLRGGMCQVSHKHAKANNKYMKEYNKDVISSYLVYLDANNLYGLSMSNNLPYGILNGMMT